MPAGLNNIVGLKATRGALSARGVLPACRTLDCVTILALTIEDARQVFDVAASYDSEDAYSRPKITYQPNLPSSPRIAVCDNPPWFGEETHSNAYLASLHKVQKLGWTLEPTSFALLFRLANLLYEGPWVAERYAAIKDFVADPHNNIDPVVRGIIDKANNFNAVDVFENEYLKVDLIRAIEEQFKDYDAILVPTTPTFPTLSDLEKEPVLENSRLGTYTNFVNFLDWSALSIPAGFRADGLPFGLTIISTRWQEEKLLQLGSKFLSTTPRQLGATQAKHQEASSVPLLQIEMSATVQLVVVGAHLTGFPLNHQLRNARATLRSTTTTSPSYRLFDLPTTNSIKKPGLKRISEPNEIGHAIEVEVWDMTHKALGQFLLDVPAPLAIGSVELLDGTWLKGFVCEPWGLKDAIEISSFGGWKAYMESINKDKMNTTTNSNGSELDEKPLFKAVLIANRGEIAVRIISTLRKLRIKSIAVYSPEDSASQHVLDADEAHLLSGDTLSSTYLSGEKIIEIAKKSGAEAIIPGYGFLSESADFATECEASGLTWIGPTPQQMHDLGLKHLARDLAQKSGIPLLPGTGLLPDIEAAVVEAENIGYPVIVKSSAGGGGIGLQQCNDVKALRGTFESIQHLGQSFFKDSSVFLEKYVEDARHVEVQIIGDGLGSVKHAGERDCSLQRRKQKVIEEGPAVFVPEKVRVRMRQAAIKLVASVSYRGVGTVEFIYDIGNQLFYFLEVNTRLQVEHPVTEAITGLDLVEAMVRIAAKDSGYLFANLEVGFIAKKVAIEARIYSESPLQAFRPSTGQLLEAVFPDDARVDTWVSTGSIISSSYDPLLAKLIVFGYDRAEAVRRLSKALDGTKISGVETNIGYLKNIVRSEAFQAGTYTTTSLDSFKFQIPVFEVLDPGPSTTIQDYPGREGLWHVGIPPSGPMDDYAFRLANRLLNNDLGAAALECTRSGPKLLFHHDAHIAVVGGSATLSINGTAVSMSCQQLVRAGQTLQLGSLGSGSRAYIAINGGINVPEVFGSRSTFALGKIGGHCGRLLGIGDMIPFYESSALSGAKDHSISSIIPAYTNTWNVKVMPGPHAFPDFFTKQSFDAFFTRPWKVHYNSNRIGVRLTGPRPEWARNNGGAAGLHPSNVHDSPYSIGSISFTGDEAVILTCDGPSLGGFLVFATIISAEMWKVGQMKPGDEIFLSPVTVSEASILNNALCKSIENLTSQDEIPLRNQIAEPILGDVGSLEMSIICRQAGDRALLLEFGQADFDIRTSVRIYALMSTHRTTPIPGVKELTPGVRSLHVLYDVFIPQHEIVNTLRLAVSQLAIETFSSGIPSRTFHLPIAFEHSSILASVSRYARTIRSSAPWLPSNSEFLRQINGLDTKDNIHEILLSATYLILGLGDVFCGSPCATPLDPRQRLFGMKYNPSRSSTPEGAVGLGGQYMCIYGIDSPGGYQLVGRTISIWNQFAKGGTKQWMFNVFDQIRFYPVSDEILDAAREKGDVDSLVSVEDGLFDITGYEVWLEKNKKEIDEVMDSRWKTLNESDAVAQALQAPPPPPASLLSSSMDDVTSLLGEAHGEVLKAGIAGKCWKSAVSVSDVVEQGQVLVSPILVSSCFT